MANSETVRYEFEIVTKGLGELQKFKDTLNELKGSEKSSVVEDSTLVVVDKYDTYIKDLNKTTEENVAATADQGNTVDLYGNRLKKATGPLRAFGNILSKLTPTTILASLGLTGFVTGVAAMSSKFDVLVAGIADTVSMMNLYSSENYTLIAGLKELDKMAADLGVSTESLSESYGKILSKVRDTTIAEGLLEKAYEIRSKSGKSLAAATDEVTQAYTEGIFVRTESGGQWLLEAAAVDALVDSYGEGTAAIKFMTETQDEFGRNMEKVKVTLTTAAAAISTGFMVLANELFDQIEMAVESVYTVFVEVPKKIWDSITGAWDGDLVSTFTTAVKELFNIWEDMRSWITSPFSKVAGAIIGAITKNWDVNIETPWSLALKGLFNVWDTVSGWISDTFSKVVGAIWNFLSVTWKSVIATPWNNALEALFNIWETVSTWISNTFSGVVGKIWSWLSDTWVTVVATPWNNFLKALFNIWETVSTWISNTFSTVVSTIWGWLSDTWETVIATPWNNALEALFNIWETVSGWLTDTFGDVATKIKEHVLDQWETLTNTPIVNAMKSLFKWENISGTLGTMISNIKEKIGGVVTWVEDTVSNIWSSITGAKEAAADMKQEFDPDQKREDRKGNKYTVEEFLVDRGMEDGTDYSNPFMVPYMAEGGIIKKPSLVVAGEREPEVIAPLSKLNSLGSGGAQTVNIYLDSKLLVSKVLDKLDRDVRMQGGR